MTGEKLLIKKISLGIKPVYYFPLMCRIWIFVNGYIDMYILENLDC